MIGSLRKKIKRFEELWKNKVKFPLTPDETHKRWAKWAYLEGRKDEAKVRQGMVRFIKRDITKIGWTSTY